MVHAAAACWQLGINNAGSCTTRRRSSSQGQVRVKAKAGTFPRQRCRSSGGKALEPQCQQQQQQQQLVTDVLSQPRQQQQQRRAQEQGQQGPLQRAAALLLAAAVSSSVINAAAPPASLAVLNAPNAKIARTSEAALRRSIPAFNADVKAVQMSLEETAFKLRIPQRKPWNSMQSDVEKALALAQDEARILDGVPEEMLPQGRSYREEVVAGLQRSLVAIAAKDPDSTSARLTRTLDAVGRLELLQAPGLAFSVPSAYASLPRLVGRAVVELRVERGDGSLAFFDAAEGGPVRTAVLQVVVNGYSAPINAGNFVANVVDGLYNNRQLSVAPNSVFVSAPSEDDAPQRLVPLEILAINEFDPVYRSPLNVQEGELPVLPLSIYGAVSHARGPPSAGDGVLSGTDFFIFKFNRQQSGLSGLSFDEGNFAVFGYVTQGVEQLPRLTAEDVIVQATVVSGLDKLVRPQQQ